MTGAVLMTWYGWLEGTVMRGWGWYGVGACMGSLYALYMWLVLIGSSAGVGEEVVRYNWLVGKLIMPPCVYRKSIPNTTGKRIFLVTTSCTWNVLSSIAMDREVITSAIRDLSSAPETENCIGCSGGTMDKEQYSCSSKRLIEKPVSIKIVIGLWSKVPDTRNWPSLEHGFEWHYYNCCFGREY